MKTIKRVVSTKFWEDDLVLNEFSPEDKYFYLYLLTNRYTSQLGIYHLPLKHCSLDMGYTLDSVNVLLDRFQNKYGVIKYNRETSEIAIRKYLLHSVVKGGTPVMDCLLKEEKEVKDKSLLRFIYDGICNYPDNTNETVIKYINHLKELLNINSNDNDNERIVDESLYESPSKKDDFSSNEIDSFFNSLWKLYPKKKGKGGVSKTQQKKLMNIGFDELSRCIDRYVDWFNSTGKDEQFMMYGSTFFNSGYVDYLDENFTEPIDTKCNSNNSAADEWQ